MRGLTDKQIAYLQAIDRWTRVHGQPPSLRDLCGLFGVTQNAVRCHLFLLEKKRCVVWDEKRSRTLRVTAEGRISCPPPLGTYDFRSCTPPAICMSPSVVEAEELYALYARGVGGEEGNAVSGS